MTGTTTTAARPVTFGQTSQSSQSTKAANSAEPAESAATKAPERGRATHRSANSEAVLGFVAGLVGLLVANVLLGPIAVGLGAHALRTGTDRRVRAVLAIILGVADVALFIALALSGGAGHGLLTWHFSGH